MRGRCGPNQDRENFRGELLNRRQECYSLPTLLAVSAQTSTRKTMRSPRTAMQNIWLK